MKMTEDTAAPSAPAARRPIGPPTPVHRRVQHGLRRPHNWIQLIKFFTVGGSGYVVNLITFWLAENRLGLHYLAAATLAFVVAVFNNFWWNRHWTFGARAGHAGFQAARFFTVSVIAFFFAAGVLELLVTNTDLPKLVAQAISIIVATPLNFIGNKMWSFAHRPRA
jgi:dolichol-phosphate mannosyltransferase